MDGLLGSVRLSSDKESIGVDQRVDRPCLMFFAFLPSELGCLSVIIGEAENGFAKMTKAFRRVEKWVCKYTLSLPRGCFPSDYFYPTKVGFLQVTPP